MVRLQLVLVLLLLVEGVLVDGQGGGVGVGNVYPEQAGKHVPYQIPQELT